MPDLQAVVPLPTRPTTPDQSKARAKALIADELVEVVERVKATARRTTPEWMPVQYGQDNRRTRWVKVANDPVAAAADLALLAYGLGRPDPKPTETKIAIPITIVMPGGERVTSAPTVAIDIMAPETAAP